MGSDTEFDLRPEDMLPDMNYQQEEFANQKESSQPFYNPVNTLGIRDEKGEVEGIEEFGLT